MLGPEAQLLHLCAHQTLHHGGGAMLWLHDVAELVSRYEHDLDWGQVVSQCRSLQLVLPTRDVLSQVSAEWRAPLPLAVLEELRALPPSPDEQWAYAALTSGHRPVARRFWTDLAGMASLRTRLAFTLVNLFPTSAYMRQRYHIRHPILLPFYYPYRWFVGLRGGL